MSRFASALVPLALLGCSAKAALLTDRLYIRLGGEPAMEILADDWSRRVVSYEQSLPSSERPSLERQRQRLGALLRLASEAPSLALPSPPPSAPSPIELLLLEQGLNRFHITLPEQHELAQALRRLAQPSAMKP